MLHYFAYGSNMLAARLKRRCPSARPLSPARLDDHALAFAKRGRDGSGKATIVPRGGECVWGVVFTLSLDDRDRLDAFEGLGRGYDRLDDCAVVLADGASLTATTYIAPPAYQDVALLPFDWYHALVLAGARENGLPAPYVAAIGAVATAADPELDRPARMEALDLLAQAGFNAA